MDQSQTSEAVPDDAAMPVPAAAVTIAGGPNTRQPITRMLPSHELAVSIGGILGASARFALGTAVAPFALAALPLGTLLVNLIGCFLIGILQTVFLELLPVRRELQLFATVGFLGGLTTFSTLSMDTVRLMQAGRVTSALVYQGLSLGGGVLACLLGIICTHAIARTVRHWSAQ